MRKLLLCMLAYSSLAFAGLPIPKDQNNTPMYSAQSYPYFATPVTLTTSSYVDVFTLPNTGWDANRIWKHIMIRNPDAARTVYICLGISSVCVTDMIKVPATFGIVLDDITIGYPNQITDIWARLDSSGSVVPEITIW